MLFLSSSQKEWSGFSLGAVNRTSDQDSKQSDDVNCKNTSKDSSYSKEPKDDKKKSESEPERAGFGLKNKSKEKRNRRRERKRNKVIEKCLKIVGNNAAGLLSKLESFEKLLVDKEPSVFCL